jgi:hypothetical protein
MTGTSTADGAAAAITVNHPTVMMRDRFGELVGIDTEIAPLIGRLWALHYTTWNSCQDNFGYVWIEFSPDDASRFLTTLANCCDPYIEERAKEPFDLSPHDSVLLVSDYCRPADYWLIAANPHYTEGEVVLSVGIRVPREHLARVMRIFFCPE